MIAVDTNILVYWHRQDSQFHAKAKAIMEPLRNSPDSWGIPWPCIHEFIGIVTHPKIYFQPSSLATAFSTIDSWMAGGNLELLSEGDSYLEKLRNLATTAKIEGARIHDARIAAICLAHGVQEFWSYDRDFRGFTSLTVKNPL